MYHVSLSEEENNCEFNHHEISWQDMAEYSGNQALSQHA